MKDIQWDEEKGKKLKKERGIGFAEAVEEILGDGLLEIIDNPNDTGYKNQRIFIIVASKYVYLIPFVQDDEKIFLKTLYASRKFTKMYKKKGVL